MFKGFVRVRIFIFCSLFRKEKMKILFVLYDYLPSGSAEAGIIGRLVGEMSKQDVSITILTTQNAVGQKRQEVSNGVEIHRIIYPAGFLLDKITNKNILLKLRVFCAKIKNKIERKKKQFLSDTLINLFYRRLEKIDAQGYDVIIPVCAFYEIYVAVKKYCDKYNSKAKIVLYQLDPLSTRKDKIEQAEKRVLLEKSFEGLNKIITTNEIKKQKESKGFKVDNIVTLEFPSINNRSVNVEKVNKQEEIRLVFAGYLSKEIRDPTYALELFSNLTIDNAKMYLIGNGANNLVAFYGKYSKGKIVSVGVLPAQKAQEWINNADFLINIGNNDINFLPSKIFDYISTGKPIINFYKDEKCPTLDYFSRYGNSISIYEKNNIESNIQLVENFILENHGKITPYSLLEKNFKENTVEYVSNRFLETIKGLFDYE